MRQLLFLFIGDFKRKSKIFELWAPGQKCITYILSIKKQSPNEIKKTNNNMLHREVNYKLQEKIWTRPKYSTLALKT